MSDTQDNETQDSVARQRRRKRRFFLSLLVLGVVVAAVLWGLWYVLYARWYESTDDAYVHGNQVQITARIPGTVVRINADDNDFVRQGQPLVRLDGSDADVALAQAKAALAQAVRRVSALYSTAHTSRAELAVRKAVLQQARSDYQRRKKLAHTGAISAEVLAHARDALITAQSALAASKAKLATAQAQIAGTDIARNPDVLAAAAKLRKAWLNDKRTVMRAPVSGYVAKRTVQVGMQVRPGKPLMAVVPLAGVWVNANFKETQLENMRIGQPATLISDLYGGSVTYHGHVAGLGIGTGSAFSLLPAQNATGNWIKIVQRLPVRIRLEPDELRKHPLRIGLSMHVKVDLHDTSGAMLDTKPARGSVLSTPVYDNNRKTINKLIAHIIQVNSAAARTDSRQR